MDRHCLSTPSGARWGRDIFSAPEQLTYRSFADGMTVCHQAMAVLKRISSPYDLSYRFSADYEWVLRCLQHSARQCVCRAGTCD